MFLDQMFQEPSRHAADPVIVAEDKRAVAWIKAQLKPGRWWRRRQVACKCCDARLRFLTLVIGQKQGRGELCCNDRQRLLVAMTKGETLFDFGKQQPHQPSLRQQRQGDLAERQLSAGRGMLVA